LRKRYKKRAEKEKQRAEKRSLPVWMEGNGVKKHCAGVAANSVTSPVWSGNLVFSRRQFSLALLLTEK
jgi:hypothetical protein